MTTHNKTFLKPSHLTFELSQFPNDEIDRILERSSNWRQQMDGPTLKYANAMRVGKWDSGNGECLAFDGKGRCVNGQHRLAAARIVQEETGRLIWFWVARNVSEVAVESMDQGRNRKVVEFLRHEGIINATEVAAIAYAAARRAALRDDATLYSVVAHNSKDATNGQVLDLYRSNSKAMQYWAGVGMKMRTSGYPRAFMLCSLLYHLHKQYPTQAVEFADRLMDGSGLAKRDPIFVLRELLHAEKLSNRKRERTLLAAVFIKAWVAWNEGREVTQLKWMSVGPKAEPFPDHRFEAS